MLQRAHVPSGDGAAAGLRVRIERIEPEPVVVGRGSVFYVEGSCFHLEAPLRTLELLLGGRRHAVTAFPFARGDLAQEYGSRALESGFCAIVPVASGEATGDRALELRATLADGRVSVHDCGPVGVVAAAPAPPVPLPTPAGDGPLVAICMATYNPRPELFARQVASIRAQTHARFVCLVADDGSPPGALDLIERTCAEDERFVLVRGEGRLGFYRNFERCLALVPPEASAVTLSDHDDEWHADKLATLVAALEGSGAQLVYSDMNIVDEEGALIAPSYWVRRRNNDTDLGSLLLANTVTGAASLFRRELLADILPLPPNVGHPYHDHWIACVALALGEIDVCRLALVRLRAARRQCDRALRADEPGSERAAAPARPFCGQSADAAHDHARAFSRCVLRRRRAGGDACADTRASPGFPHAARACRRRAPSRRAQLCARHVALAARAQRRRSQGRERDVGRGESAREGDPLAPCTARSGARAPSALRR